MCTSFAAAFFILLPAAAGTGLVAPDLLLFQYVNLRRSRIEFRQKRFAYIFMRKIHREELLPQILLKYFRRRRDVLSLSGISRYSALSRRLSYTSGNSTGSCTLSVFSVIILTYTIRDALINSAIPQKHHKAPHQLVRQPPFFLHYEAGIPSSSAILRIASSGISAI